VVSLTLLGWILVRGPASLESRRPV
jgi:hypothetical protein